MGEEISLSSQASAQSVEITVNGERTQVAPELTLEQLLGTLGIAADRVAVELNRQIVNKRNWPLTRISPGAQLEIVQFVGGG